VSAALRFQRVWKAYPRWPSGTRTVRAVVTRRVPLLARSGYSWALSDVSFDVPAGGSLGLIGPNGAGKSTLLRLAAGLGRTTRGTIEPPDDAAAVLSLGDTLDPKLSGRENALTAALVDGWSLDDAKRALPAIADYAELEEQFDAPVRTYSDGMRVRLAFAVIAQRRPEVLMVDEVISVGDLAFQARCAATIREMRAQGTTLVLASHDLGLVERECEHALWLDRGEPRMLGPAAEVVVAYREAAHQRVVEATPAPQALGGRLELRKDRVGTQQLTIDSVQIDPNPVGRGERVAMRLGLRNHGEPVTDPIVEIKVARADDDALCFHTTTRDSGIALGRVTGTATVSLALERVDLLPGPYTVDLGVYSNDWQTTSDYHWHGYEFHVAGEAPSRGLLAPPQSWSAELGG
jgi:lipopolysaccharide transport system ATP-binding protein